MILKIAFLYFGYIAWGCLALLPLVSLKEIGKGFYRFFGFLCLGLDTLSVGIALYEGQAFSESYRYAAWALASSLFFTLCFTVALKARFRPLVWTAYFLAILSGAVSLAYFPCREIQSLFFSGFHALTSALVLGAGVLAMMLGHWYLVTPKLSITPLKRYSAAYILLTALTALKLALSYHLFVGWGLRPVTQGGVLLMGEDMIFVLFRVTWGVLAPLAAAYFIWGTVKIKSTQSATGILYPSMVCTIIGEGMGLFLTLSTGVPF